MSPEYDSLVRAYQRSKSLPFRVYSEIPNHLESLGDLRGLDVLDLACGEGFYTRLIKQAGGRPRRGGGSVAGDDRAGATAGTTGAGGDRVLC